MSDQFSAPTKKAGHRGGPFAVLRRAKAVRNARDEALDQLVSDAEVLGGKVRLVGGARSGRGSLRVASAAKLAPGRRIVCNSAVAVGVAFELIFSRAGTGAQAEAACR